MNVFARLEWRGNPLIWRALESEWVRLVRVAASAPTASHARLWIVLESRAS